MINFHRLTSWLFPDRRPDWEQKREREFILAANKLKTLSVTDRGGMSIDPEEIREQIIASREQLKHLVRKPGAPSSTLKVATDTQVDQEAILLKGGPADALDCVEVVVWRRLPSGAAVRYVCVQSLVTGSYAVATASLFSGGTESLPPWVDGNTSREVATALQSRQLRWFGSVSEAMNAWDEAL
ncbi:Uncharacterized protein ALO82_01745 [Pseudomonas syringae pv. broussonetiae]|uniref:Uncharacterized protein n=1 Tax=Pseudomonas savastanoi TaxID=29438 RepID=A0A3M5JQK3_PSESS|nr:hypothetical protein [Pseudomonas savastanoi]KPW68365.1 Uncharacterized protein ALO82_01745 [Pseudomonas syringae pv. broussonetiae]KWT03288.1 hypothetical protein AL047_26815 [Pseudomonas syringae pv. broussonetiae]RMT25569.1 hypothetical protein ALP51_02949 [Pseudomonas savastanoi]